MHEFKTYHPIVNFIYFAFVIVFSCLLLHPVFLSISFACAVAYALITSGRRTLKFVSIYIIPLMLLTAVINSAFNHGGVTVICYLPSGNPLTAESVIYGFAMGAMLASVICFFASYNKVMTSDKFIYLFGRVIPSLSLFFSMVLRFVPRFKTQFMHVRAGQKCIGKDITDGGVIKRAKSGLKILSAMISWSLESAIETADSMKSRGYGLSGRTAYSDFVFDKRDKFTLSIILVLGAYVIAGMLIGATHYSYVPTVKVGDITPYSVSVAFAYFALCAVPVIIECWEARKWKLLKRNI